MPKSDRIKKIDLAKYLKVAPSIVRVNQSGTSSGGSTTIDEKIKVSSDDNSNDYLSTKLVEGDGISLTVLNGGSTETLSVASEAVVVSDAEPSVMFAGQIWIDTS